MIKCQCIVCNRPTNHTILKEEIRTLDDENGWWEETTYQIVQCAGCEKITFRQLYTDISQFDGEDHFYDVVLFPKRSSTTRDIKPTKNLPQNLTVIYRETIDAFNNGQYLLCTAGLRTLIEGICTDKAIAGKEITNKKGQKIVSTSLESKIDGLSINRFLTEDNCAALHELRFLGNEALHELNPPKIDDLIIAIEIIELTLSNIYELGHKSRTLRKSAENRIK